MTELPAGATVSGIVPDARHPGTVRLEVAGKVLLTVPVAALDRLQVTAGSLLEPRIFQELCQSADAEAAYRSALACLGRRPFSRRDLARRLVMRGHPPAAADQAVERAESVGLVNDETYARHFVQTRSARGRGPMRLRRELAVMGVASAIIDRVLAEEAETRRIPGRAHAGEQARGSQLGGVERQDRIRRVVAFLARRGYAGSDVREVVREVGESRVGVARLYALRLLRPVACSPIFPACSHPNIRRLFLDYFVARGHREVPSSSLVPADDPTLLFTNAGMVQFKRTFLGQEQRDYSRAVTSQKCVRAGGKHNDLEQVGLTRRHHTFFEMLGNFSFGDYFKEDAIAFAWEFVTGKEYLGLDPEKLRVTSTTPTTRRVRSGVPSRACPDSRIYSLGDKDNFWQMGDTGPCGPCSEIYVDLESADRRSGGSAELSARPSSRSSAESGEFLEIWNLVFMQFDRSADGTLTPLPKPSVDTGAGLERIASVLQRTDDNFHIDLFMPLLEQVGELVGTPYPGSMDGPGASYRVLADHARAVSFLLADGVYPGERGSRVRPAPHPAPRGPSCLAAGTARAHAAPAHRHRGRPHGRPIRISRPSATSSAKSPTTEENRFLETIEGGLGRLEELFASGVTTIPGEEAFRLYDTFGFPLDLTQLIAAERGVAVDTAGFDAALGQQRHPLARSEEGRRRARRS